MIWLFYIAPMMLNWLFLMVYSGVTGQRKNKIKILFLSVTPVINIISAMTAILVSMDEERDQ